MIKDTMAAIPPSISALNNYVNLRFWQVLIIVCIAVDNTNY